MNNIMYYVSLVSAAIVFVHSVCQISIKKWHWSQIELYAYAVMTAGSLGSLLVALTTGRMNHNTAVVVNVGLAIYFIARSWRLYSIAKKKLNH